MANLVDSYKKGDEQKINARSDFLGEAHTFLTTMARKEEQRYGKELSHEVLRLVESEVLSNHALDELLNDILLFSDAIDK